jgi:hypothetical protein
MHAVRIFVLSAALSLVLTGCGVQSAVIRSQALSYDDVIEDTTDKLLLLNILRAKDKAPLHFDEIPRISESIQATASVQATWPFGATDTANKPMTRNTVTPGLQVQATPTFEVDHLDTKDFVTGIASPIDPKFVKYWLDRGLDRRIVLLLFFSAATITEVDTSGGQKKAVRAIRLMNSPRAASETLKEQLKVSQESQEGDVSEELLRCDTLSDFQHYLKFIDFLAPFAPQYYKERHTLAKNVTIDVPSLLKELGSMDPAKYQLTPNSEHSGNWDVAAISAEPKTELCPIGAAPASPGCMQLDVDTTAEQASAGQVSPWPSPMIENRGTRGPSRYCALFNGLMAGHVAQDASNPQLEIDIRLEMRSVGEMIQFLGDLLEYQDELAGVFGHDTTARQLKLNEPLTFGYCADEPPGLGRVGCDDVFFNLPSDTCNSRFAVTYRGRTYAVPNYEPPGTDACQTGEASRRSTNAKDHTLEVLSVVHQMVDLQKSAQDIRETPYVQVLP